MATNNDAYKQLAHWLQRIVASSAGEAAAFEAEDDNALPNSEPRGYHPGYYRQLPDLAMALLRHPGDPHALLPYTALLYHLAGCPDCREAYLDLYRALRPTLETDHSLPPLDYGMRSLSAISAEAQAHLCQSLISQSEAVLRQARRDSTDGSDQARALLQLAMRFSAHIIQPGMRGVALADLVRVATLFDGPHSPGEETPAAHSYTPLVGAAGPRGGAHVARRGVAAVRSQPAPSDTPAIYLQAHHLEGSITQQGETLELHLHDLDATLRGRSLLIAIPLGGLLEPVRWRGGNPRAIRALVPVAADGSLDTPLGTTDLRLADPEERNLLEAMFRLIEVRPAE
jgi:hypothetical protein